MGEWGYLSPPRPGVIFRPPTPRQTTSPANLTPLLPPPPVPLTPPFMWPLAWVNAGKMAQGVACRMGIWQAQWRLAGPWGGGRVQRARSNPVMGVGGGAELEKCSSRAVASRWAFPVLGLCWELYISSIRLISLGPIKVGLSWW